MEKLSHTNTGLEYLPYKFTAKELDEETGLYYYGARYLNPKYSMWLSCDPALSDYMAGSSVGCGGIYNHINLNLYHYGGNNPIRYIDPTGRYTDEWIKSLPICVRQYIKDMAPNRFSQKLWTADKGFYEDEKTKAAFWKTACLATSILNVISAIYQKETGKILTEELAIGALKAAIDAKHIDPKDAYVSDIAGVANAMAVFLKMKGTFSSNEKSPEYMIYAIDNVTYMHFVKALKNEIGSQYFDVWDGKTKSYSKTTTNEEGEEITENLINLQEGRPIRGLDYKIPYQNWSMIDRASVQE